MQKKYAKKLSKKKMHNYAKKLCKKYRQKKYAKKKCIIMQIN